MHRKERSGDKRDMDASAPEYVVGLDLGSEHVRCLIAEMGDSDQLKIVGIGESQTSGFRRGEVTDLQQGAADVATAVRRAEENASVEVETLFVGVGSCHTRGFNSRGCIPVTSENRLIGEADRLKALTAAESVFLPNERQVISAVPQRYCLDHLCSVNNPVGMTAMQLEAEVHLVTDTAAMMSNLAKCIEETDYRAEDFVFQPLATAREVLTDDERELGVILVDIGSWSTDVAFFSSGVPRHSQILPVGGHHVTNDIALGLNISLQEAERVKLELASASLVGMSREERDRTFEAGRMDGQSVEELSVGDLVEIVEFRIDDIFSLIKRGLEQAGMDHYPRAGVVLTGGTARLSGILRKARDAFNTPVRLGKPQILSEMEGVSGNPELSAAVGLLSEGVLRRRKEMQERQARGGVLARTAEWIGSWIRNTF